MKTLRFGLVGSAVALSAVDVVLAASTDGSGSTGLVSAPTTVAVGSSSGFLSTLTAKPAPGSYHMTPVRSVQARVQSDAPVWNAKGQRFVSKYYPNLQDAYVGLMDTVNTASVEGALMYVQAEGINYQTRAAETRCERKSNMAYVVFYDIAITQTNETLALYAETADQNEYGPMIPMDSGRCTPLSGSGSDEVFPPACSYFNGVDGEPNVGPFVGGESKVTDARTPYPDNVWFSFPNTCPLSTWSAKTAPCRTGSRQGLCDMGVLPNGVDCTFTYRVLGFLPIDDLVGITSMVSNTTNQPFRNFTEFCEAGGVEFLASEDGVWEQSIPFWLEPQDEDANAARAQVLVATYQNLTSGGKSGQLTDELMAHMLPLPTIDELRAENPPCYMNVAKCNTRFGCKRDKYAQLCTVCTSAADGCVAPPSDFTFPTLAKAVGTNGGTGNASANASRGNSTDGGNAPGGVSSTATVRGGSSAVLFAVIAAVLVSAVLFG